MAKRGLDRLAGSLGQAIQRHAQRIEAQQQLASAISMDRANKAFQVRQQQEQQRFQENLTRTRAKLRLDLFAKETEAAAAREAQRFKNEKDLISLRDKLSGAPDRELRREELQMRKRSLADQKIGRQSQVAKARIDALRLQQGQLNQMLDPEKTIGVDSAVLAGIREQQIAVGNEIAKLTGTVPLQKQINVLQTKQEQARQALLDKAEREDQNITTHRRERLLDVIKTGIQSFFSNQH